MTYYFILTKFSRAGILSHDVQIKCKGRKISKSLSQAITLFVRASSHEMLVEVSSEDTIGRKSPISINQSNVMDFGNIEIHEKSIRTLNIVNVSDNDIEYTWSIKGDKSIANILAISPDTGIISPDKRTRCALTYQPTQLGPLSYTILQLKITDGDVYKIDLTGNSISPGVFFSFLKHDFGPTFIYNPGMPLVIQDLQIINRDYKEISIDCNFEKVEWLDFDFEPIVIKPGQIVACGFNFKPLEEINYSGVVEFLVNGLSSYKVG